MLCNKREEQMDEIFEVAFEKMRGSHSDSSKKVSGVPVLIITESTAEAIKFTARMRQLLEERLKRPEFASQKTELLGNFESKDCKFWPKLLPPPYLIYFVL